MPSEFMLPVIDRPAITLAEAEELLKAGLAIEENGELYLLKSKFQSFRGPLRPPLATAR